MLAAVLAIAFWGGALLGVYGAVKLWRAPLNHRSYEKPSAWPWSEASWKGYRRTILPAALVAVCFATGLTVLGTIGVYFALAGMFIFFPLMITITLFNRPRILVPPASRRDKGLLSDLLERAARHS